MEERFSEYSHGNLAELPCLKACFFHHDGEHIHSI